MKMLAFSVSEDEKKYFEKYGAEYGIDIEMTDLVLDEETAPMTRGHDAVNVLSSRVIEPKTWDALKAGGVRHAVTRTIGKEHMNEEYAASIGINVYNITYSPSSVADYAIMLMIMVLRRIKPMVYAAKSHDFTQRGILGREISHMKVGIIGAGRIGCVCAKHLSGFGCEIFYSSRTEKEELKGIAKYVSVDELLKECDVVSLHLASNDDTHHFMNRDRIFSMKRDAVLINTARGPLVDTDALIEALECGHLWGAGLDVFEGDRNIYYSDFKSEIIDNHDMAILEAMPNVIMLPHMAYYTDVAMEDMVRNGIAAVARG